MEFKVIRVSVIQDGNSLNLFSTIQKLLKHRTIFKQLVNAEKENMHLTYAARNEGSIRTNVKDYQRLRMSCY